MSRALTVRDDTTPDDSVSVPGWVADIHTFRQWLHSDEFPEVGRICWLGGYVWVDMSKQDVFAHVAVKTEYTFVLHGITKAEEAGLYLTDGVRLTNFPADISVVPDGLFLSNETLDDDLVRFIEGSRGGYTELQGSPDMALEIVSNSSVRKDTDVLRRKYWEAGVREYWLVDARREPVKFTIFRRTARGYAARPRTADGWVKSVVFGKSFRLTQGRTARGQPKFTLDVR